MPKPSLRNVVPGLLALLLVSLATTPAAWAFEPEHLEVELVAETTTVQPGTSVLVGIRLAVEEHWHVYWKNPGAAGTAVGITWTLPTGWSVGPILWTAPKTMTLSGLVTYGYQGTFILPMRIEVPADAPEGEVTLSAVANWVVCHEVCVQGDAERTLVLKVSKASPVPGPHQALFEAAKAAWPKAFPAGVTVTARAIEKAIELVLTGPGAWTDPATELYAFTEMDGVGPTERHRVDPNAKQKVTRAGETTSIHLPLEKRRKKPPETLVGMLVVEHAKGRTAYALDVPVAAPVAAQPVEDPPPPAPAVPVALEESDVVPPGFSDGPKKGTYTLAILPTVLTSSGQVVDALSGKFVGEAEEERHPLWLLLLGALVGGMVLNIMPCVLPVLSIKVLGFVSQAEEHPAKVRLHAYAFAAGVLASFWALAIVILLLREGGKELGWGFHFQSPVFVASMAVLMFAVGMNLTGAFEFGLSVQTLAGDAATKIHSGGYGSSFWSGALATVIATPCTAPMMGPAVGYAMTAPIFHCVLVFTALGVGMALPYVLLSMSPRLLKKVPRPGPWMETFKHALAFPMFATVIWLGFVLADHVGAHGVLWMFMSLLVLGLALWIYGHWGTPSTSTRKRWIVGYGLAALAVLGAWRLMVRALNEKAPEAVGAPRVAGGAVGEDEIHWEKWSRERVAWRLSQGHVVFVDFTAKWCVSCLANESAFIDTQPVRDAIKQYNVSMLKADYTREDPDIHAGLAEFRRSSVPLYLVYRPLVAATAAGPTDPPAPPR